MLSLTLWVFRILVRRDRESSRNFQTVRDDLFYVPFAHESRDGTLGRTLGSGHSVHDRCVGTTPGVRDGRVKGLGPLSSEVPTPTADRTPLNSRSRDQSESTGSVRTRIRCGGGGVGKTSILELGPSLSLPSLCPVQAQA